MAPVTEGRVLNGDTSIYYRCFGKGKPLILLHGNGEDYTCFEKVLEDFSKHFFIVAIDSRGHGKSGYSKKITIDLMAKDVIAVLDKLKLDKVSLLGFSDGANVAIAFTLMAKDRLDKLVLAGANLYPSGIKEYYQIPTVFKYVFLRFCSILSKNAYEKSKIIGLMVLEPHFKPRQLSAIDVPTLVLAGEKDMIKEKHTRLIASSIKGADLIIIKGADHFIFDMEPIESVKIVLNFLLN
ncbi:MAG: alpha/beta hydrolase [Eubacteriales bacterium]